MKNITLKKEDIGKGELVLINPDYTLKSTINNLVSFDEEYNNIKLNNRGINNDIYRNNESNFNICNTSDDFRDSINWSNKKNKSV